MTGALGNLLVVLRGLGAVPMGLLYGGLDQRDAAQVVAALERAQVPFRIGASGADVFAPADQVPRLRLQLARDGIPAGGSVGYEIFDRQGGLTATPFQQDLNRLRALEGEIGVCVGCSVYATRPLVCREFQAGSADCLMVRRKLGFGID